MPDAKAKTISKLVGGGALAKHSPTREGNLVQIQATNNLQTQTVFGVHNYRREHGDY